MKADRLAKLLFHLAKRSSRGDAARKVWHVGGVIVARFLDHDGVAHPCLSLMLACFIMLFTVPGAMSSEGLPAIVTRPRSTTRPFRSVTPPHFPDETLCAKTRNDRAVQENEGVLIADIAIEAIALFGQAGRRYIP
jgi:hypothetical protein